MRRSRITIAVIALASVAGSPVARAERVTLASIGCDDLTATLMAEEALRDKLSGKDHNAMDRITAYRKRAGMDACRPLSQGDQVRIVRTQDDMVCVRELNEQLNGPNAPECYWMRLRHIKRPNG